MHDVGSVPNSVAERLIGPRDLANLIAMRVNMHEAKSRLSELVAAAEAGEEVVIARNGEPAVRLTPVSPKYRPVRLGILRGQVEIGDDFDEPLDDFAPYTS